MVWRGRPGSQLRVRAHRGRVGEVEIRRRLAVTVVGVGLGVVALLSALVIWFATPEGRPEASRLVFASVLPLLGTWVGTVLAFYFARESLDAVTDSNIKFGRNLRPQTPVREVMIPRERISAQRVSSESDAKAIRLSELLASMRSSGYKRVPIWTKNYRLVYVIHDSTLAAYAESGNMRLAELTTETVGDLAAKPDCKALVTAIGFVGVNDVVERARTAMAAISNCNDVFVTDDGSETGAVRGWLTNTDLAGSA